MSFSSLIHEIKNKFLIYSIGQGFNLVSPIIIAPYIISVCKLDSFGKIGLGFAFSLFLILIVDYAFDIKGTKKISESRNSYEQLHHQLVITLFTKVVLVVIAFLIAFLIISFVPMFSTERTLFFLSFTIVFAQVFNPTWFLQGLEDFKTSSLINILSKSTYLIMVFLFVKQKEDYILVNFLLGLSSLIFNLIALFYIFKKFNFTLFYPKFEQIKEIIVRDFMFCMSQLSLSLRQHSPLLMVSYLLGFSYGGQYKVVEQIVSLYRTFSQVYLRFFFPKLCFKFSVSIPDTIVFWKKYTTAIFVFVVISTCILGFISEDIITFFNVPLENRKILSSVVKFALIIPSLMVLSISLELAMFLIQKDKQYIRIIIAVTLINVLMLVTLVPIFQLYGVVMSILVAELLFVLLFYSSIISFKKNQIQC